MSIGSATAIRRAFGLDRTTQDQGTAPRPSPASAGKPQAIDAYEASRDPAPVVLNPSPSPTAATPRPTPGPAPTPLSLPYPGTAQERTAELGRIEGLLAEKADWGTTEAGVLDQIEALGVSPIDI